MRIVMLGPPGAARERRQLCFPTRFLLILRRLHFGVLELPDTAFAHVASLEPDEPGLSREAFFQAEFLIVDG
jgi:hypothetical protein